ncbi:MAG: ABC transporter ATP-binding protein [Spirochaetaceae bacterium]|nr:ABC transporter ATP-binding protein [Spirochaetaceae bacterium]
MGKPLLEVQNLKTYFHTENGTGKAVDGVSFQIDRKKTLGVVGESGCGKSVTAMSVMGLIPQPPGKIESGSILFHGEDGEVDLTALPPKGTQYRKIRGNEIAMIFQEPMTSLNPVYTIGYQISEAIILHQNLSKSDAKIKAIEMLRAVGIPLPERRVNEFPFQLSGGMRQRAMIAMALSCRPSLLIADEPTTALDVTIQAQVLNLMNKLKEDFDTSVLFITHDMGVIAEMADDIVIMYLGKIVESGPVSELFRNPKHPYTVGLLQSIPSITDEKKDKLQTIEGNVPSPFNIPEGCGFAPRCSRKMDICTTEAPSLKESDNNHKTSCWLYS